jgi:hypothetical protein
VLRELLEVPGCQQDKINLLSSCGEIIALVQAEMGKRQEREEDEGIAVAVRDLESAVQKGSADAKVKVCNTRNSLELICVTGSLC